jgi:phage terminase large subunit
MIRQNSIQEFQEAISRYWNQRALFVDEVIGVDLTHFRDQVEILNALDNHDHVVVRSGHKVGKTAIESWTVLHYLTCRPFPKIVATAPSRETLFNVLWAELAKWHRRMLPVFRDQLLWTKQKMVHRLYPEDWFAVARTATKERSEALQGFHADYLLRIIDESSGVPEAIFETLEGADGVIETKELQCGNPTRIEGNFFQAFNKDKELYSCHKLSSLDSHLHAIKDFAYCKRIAKKYGEDSNMYRVRVLGEFPIRDGDSFIPYDLAHAATEREIEPQDHLPMVYGLDVARHGGDQTRLARRRGDLIKLPELIQAKDLMGVANAVARAADKDKPIVINIDAIGMGWGVHDRLDQLGYPVRAINVSELPAYNSREYHRLRDELWGSMRSWLESRRGRIEDNEDGDLVGQLTTPKYSYSHDNKVVIETKKQMRSRGVSSPDMADAANLTFADPVAAYANEEYNDFFEHHWGRDDTYQPFDAEAGY